MTTTHTRSTSGRCRKTPAAGGAQGFVTFPCLPALSASRAEPAPVPAPRHGSYAATNETEANQSETATRAGQCPRGATTRKEARHATRRGKPGQQDPAARRVMRALLPVNSRPAPAGRAFLRHRSSMVERPAHNGLVAGSIPAGATIEPLSGGASLGACNGRSVTASRASTRHPSAVWHVRYRCGARSSGRLTLAGTAALTPPWPSQQSRQYARAGLHLSPRFGGVPFREPKGARLKTGGPIRRRGSWPAGHTPRARVCTKREKPDLTAWLPCIGGQHRGPSPVGILLSHTQSIPQILARIKRNPLSQGAGHDRTCVGQALLAPPISAGVA